jgi:DNA recombination protein RmuC
MDVLTFLLGAAVGCISGGAIAYLLARARGLRAAYEARTHSSSARRLEQELAALRHDCVALAEERAALQTELDMERAAGAEKRALLEDARERLAATFRTLSAEALNMNTHAFLEMARQCFAEQLTVERSDGERRAAAIHDMVRPLGENLRQIEEARLVAYVSLQEQLRALETMQKELRSETANLVKALRLPTVRGRWGEIQLRRVVELAGMEKHCDFFEQASADGGQVRPDMLIRLPGDRNIIVDAKAPLAAYLEAIEAGDEGVRDAHYRAHASQVREHVVQLARRDYPGRFQPTPELVVLFLPGDALYHAALQYDLSLLEFALERHVVLASPMTLVALLKTVAYGWKQDALTKNAREISRLGRELHDRIRTWAEHLSALGSALDHATRSYNSAIGSLERSVLPGARRFVELNAVSGEDIPALEPVDGAARTFIGSAERRRQEDRARPPLAGARTEGSDSDTPAGVRPKDETRSDLTRRE